MCPMIYALWVFIYANINLPVFGEAYPIGKIYLSEFFITQYL